jgi:hypothetical protein
LYRSNEFKIIGLACCPDATVLEFMEGGVQDYSPIRTVSRNSNLAVIIFIYIHHVHHEKRHQIRYNKVMAMIKGALYELLIRFGPGSVKLW